MVGLRLSQVPSSFRPAIPVHALETLRNAATFLEGSIFSLYIECITIILNYVPDRLTVSKIGNGSYVTSFISIELHNF